MTCRTKQTGEQWGLYGDGLTRLDAERFGLVVVTGRRAVGRNGGQAEKHKVQRLEFRSFLDASFNFPAKSWYFAADVYRFFPGVRGKRSSFGSLMCLPSWMLPPVRRQWLTR